MLRQTRFCVPQERSTRSCLPHHRQPVRQERQNTGDRFRSLTHSLLTDIAGSFSLSLSLSSPDSTKEKKNCPLQHELTGVTNLPKLEKQMVCTNVRCSFFPTVSVHPACISLVSNVFLFSVQLVQKLVSLSCYPYRSPTPRSCRVLDYKW